MEGLLERLARLSLKKSGQLSHQIGKYGGAAVGGPAGAVAGELAGRGVQGLYDTLAEYGQGENPAEHQLNNVGAFRNAQPTFLEQLLGNVGSRVGEGATDIAGQSIGNYLSPEEGAPELDTNAELEKLLDSLSPEDRNALLAKYMKGS